MKIRCYAKSELAQLYFPKANVHIATNRLTRWINSNKELIERLERNGYNKLARFYTSKQVEIIFELLGAP